METKFKSATKHPASAMMPGVVGSDEEVLQFGLTVDAVDQGHGLTGSLP